MTRARLLACPGCARHVRVGEPSCVFCGRVLPESFADAPVLPPPPKMNRGALFTYRARVLAASTVALVTTSCGATLNAGSSGSDSDGASESDGGASDGGSTSDSPSDAAPPFDANREGGVAIPAYGAVYPFDAPFEDAEPVDASGGGDASGGADAELDAHLTSADAAYGLPPPDGATSEEGSAPRDASDGDVRIALPYGLPPIEH